MDDRGAHVAEDEIAVAGRELLQGSVLPVSGRPEVPAVRLTARLAEARRATTRYLHQVRHQPPPSRSNAPLLVLVPAHDDEATVGRTLEALLTSSRVPDRVVLLADGCTDRDEVQQHRHERDAALRRSWDEEEEERLRRASAAREPAEHPEERQDEEGEWVN